jgi:HlyD family secretion protein
MGVGNSAAHSILDTRRLALDTWHLALDTGCMLKWIVGILALLGAAFAIVQSVRATTPPAFPPLKNEPARMPFAKGIAGAGIVEPESQNVVIGVSDPGLVTNVYVVPGQVVKKDEPLFRLDTRSLEADLKTALANELQFKAALDLVVAYRRKEEEPGLRARVAQGEAGVLQAQRDTAAAEAAVAQDEANVADYQDRVTVFTNTVKENATSKFELNRAKFQLDVAYAKLNASRAAVTEKKAFEQVAAAQLEQAKSDLGIFLAGPWKPNVAKAEADLAQAKAQVGKLETEIKRRTMTAPREGVIIACYLKEGEYAVASRDQAENAAVVLGSSGPLHVRVDIDEFDAPRFRSGLPAVALLKGTSRKPLPLEFVRLEPFITPKRALTNSQRELVDTRVLQPIYRIKPTDVPVYVGQQVDVFIDTTSVE